MMHVALHGAEVHAFSPSLSLTRTDSLFSRGNFINIYCLHDTRRLLRSDSRILQGYLAHKKNAPPSGPTVAFCLGPYGDPRGWAFSSGRSTPVFHISAEDGVRVTFIDAKHDENRTASL